MTDTFALGKKENIDFNKLKSGITKKELGIENNTILSNIFDSIDKGDENVEGKGNGRLERKELITFINKIKELAGKDRKLSKKEAKEYEIDGNKLGKDKEQLLEFLKKLSELTKGVQSVDENEVVLYEDGHAVQILANGNKKTTSSDKNRITTTDENDEVVEETVVDEDKKTTTNFKNNKKIKSVTENTDNGEKETIIYNEDGKTPKSKVTDFEGTTTTFIYDSAKNKYKPLSEDIKIGDRVKHTEYDSENSDENERQVKQSTVTRNGQLVAKTKNGHSVEYDGQGNTYIIVQPDERDAGKIAKKFGCNKEKLVEINNGKYCFEPGERIKIPQQLEPNEEVLKDRLSSADSKAQYKEECRQKEEAERARQQRAAVARTNATRATKQTTSVRSTAKVNDWQGQKGKDWKYAAIVWDKGATPESMARNLFKREGINNPSASAVSARAKAIYSAFKDIFDKNRKVAKSKLLYYRVSTKAGIVATGTNGYYVKKDANGELVYFDKWNRQISGEKFKKYCPAIYASVTGTERPMSANQKKIQHQSAQQIVADLKKAIRGWNDHDAIRNALNKIDNQEELLEVNRLLAKEGYKSDNMYSSLEKFIKEETQRIATDYTCPDLENYIQKWINNGTLKGDYAVRAQARMAARVIIDAGDGFGTDYKKTVKGIRMIKAPKGQGKAGAKKVYDQVNKIIASHRTFYGIGTRSKGLIDYLQGEVWASEIKYLKGILAETNAIQGKEKAQAIKDLTQEAVEGAGTDIEYLEQAIKGIDSPEDRRAVEAKLKQYCQKKGIKPQIQGQSYLQAILYDECDIMGISRDHKEIRKFNEMLISQGAYTKEEIVNLRAEQAALQILEGNFINAQDAVQQIKDPKVYAKALQLIQNKCGKNLDNFLLSKLGQQKTDLVEAELAANSLIGGDKAANIAYRLIQSSDFNVRAKGLMAIRNGDVARKVDSMLKARGSSLAKVMEQFNKEKAEYRDKAALWDGIAMFGGGLIAEHISDRYRDNTDVSDNMYVEATNTIPLTQKQKDAYNQAVKTFEECLNKMKSDYQQALDSQGVVSAAINAFCSVYNLGTTRDEIEARIEHDTETLRLLKLAAKGKLTKYVNGREIIVSFEDVWKERQSDRVTANAVTLTNAIESVKGKKEVTFDVKKVEKVENKAQTLAAMDYAKDNIVVCWDELSSARTERQYAVAIMDTLEKLSNMSGKKMSLSYVGCSLKNGIIVDKTGKPVPTAKLQELANQLKKGLSDVSNSLFGTSLSQDSSSNKVSNVLEKSYEKKVENFKQDYRDAFGQECPDEMIESYMTTISRGMMVANVAVAIGAMVAAPFTGGGSLAVFAITAGATAAMNGLEHSTDADGWTNSEWTTDLSQAAWDGALAACGYKIGQIAEAFAKGASALSGSNKWISTMLNKMPKAQATKALAKAEEIANKVQTYAGKVGKNVLQTTKANLLKKYPTMKPETAEKVAIILTKFKAIRYEAYSDALQSLIQMYCMEGEFNVESFTTALCMSIGANTVGHVVAARSAKKEVKANSTTPQEYPSAHAARRGGRDAIADGETARNADQSHLNANERKIVEDGIDDVPTKEEVDAYQHEHGYKKPTAEEKAAIDKNNAEADAANREAHKVENNIDNSSADALTRAKESASDVDFNKNGVFKNENADFVVQNGKVTEIRTKDGRVITDELKIAKYLDKNGIELKNLTPEKVAEPKVETSESKVETEESRVNESKVETEESKATADEVKVEAEEPKVKTDEPKVEAEESKVDVDEPEIKTGHQQNTAKSYSEMDEDELFATYYQLRNEVKYSPLSNADKAAKINELKKIEAELDNKGFRIEGDELVSNKKKANEAKSNDNVKSEDIDMSVEPDLTTESVRQKYGKKIARMYNAVTNSIEKMKTIADFEKIKNYITNKFSVNTELLHNLYNKLLEKAKKLKLSTEEMFKPTAEEIANRKINNSKYFTKAQVESYLTGNRLRREKIIPTLIDAGYVFRQNDGKVLQLFNSQKGVLLTYNFDDFGKVISQKHSILKNGRAVETLEVNFNVDGTRAVRIYGKSNNIIFDKNFAVLNSENINPQRLQKGQPFEVQGDAKLKLADEVEIDLNEPHIKSIIDNLPEGGKVTIGREGYIRIDNDYNHVSRVHVIIEKHNGKIYVIDNSSNGTVITQTTKSAKSTTSNARKGNNADPIKERAYRRFNKNATPEKMPDNGFLNRNSQYVINPNDMPSLRLIDGTMVDLNSSEIRNAVLNLKDGEYLTLGRNGDFKISNSSNVSRHHIIIAKENGQIQLKDVSSYGCTRAFNQAEREVRDNVIRKFNKNSPTIELTANATMNPNMNYILDFNNLPKLRLNDGTIIDLNEAKYYNAIQHLKAGGFITLGRTGFADIGISRSNTISRHHIILTIQDGELIMKDVSMNGGTSNVGDKYGFYSRSHNRTENSDESYNRDNSYRRHESNQSNSSKISQEQVKEYKNLLEIDENIALTKDAIKKAYRKKSLEWHPDRHPDNIEEATEMMKKINEAKEELDKLVA